MVDEGVPAAVVDKAATEFGMPMGPIELADTVGLDICLSVATNMSAILQVEIPASIEKLIGEGHFGSKSGRGFYQWRNGRPEKKHPKDDATLYAALAERMIDPLINESIACLRDGVVADEALVDAGVIFGTGFAPFRGGPIQHAKSCSLPKNSQQQQKQDKPIRSSL